VKKKYSVCIVLSADSHVDVEADSPEEAAELAACSDEASPFICHQCNDGFNLGEAYRFVVYDEDDKEVWVTDYSTVEPDGPPEKKESNNVESGN